MAGLDGVEWEVCLLEPVRNRERERALRAAHGIVPHSARYFLDSSWLSGAMARFLSTPVQHLAPEMIGMITLIVSQDNSCCYCYTATRGFMKILGFSESHIRRLEENFLAADLTSADTAALEFARCVSRGAPLPSLAHAEPLFAAGYGTAAIKELAFFAAHSVFLNRVSTLPALPPREADFAERWWLRLLRPLIAPYVRAQRLPDPVPLEPAQRDGVFRDFVNALDGLPSAPRLRAVLDEAWRSPALSARLKALVFGVVARGIGCAPAEREAVRLLLAEDMSPSQVEHALAHLSGGDLEPADQAALELARGSIWYEPAQLQRRARATRALFSPEQFVDLIGITALANTVCRLSVALDVAQREASAPA